MATSIPQAVPQFISIAQAALPSGFQIQFGTIFDPNIQPQALLVTGVNVILDAYAEMSPVYRHEEHYNIECTLSGLSGQPGQDAVIFSQVYQLYDDIAIAVANNPNLNNTVRLAWCRQLKYQPGRDAKGLLVGTLDFEVQCQQRVNSLS